MELNGDHMPETEEYGNSSTVFRAGRPLHPGRLWEFVTEGLDSVAYGQILRSKGLFWLASRPRVTGLWSQADAVASTGLFAVLQPCDTDRRPRGMPIRLGPVTGSADGAAVGAWCARAADDGTLPQRLRAAPPPRAVAHLN